MEQNLHCIFVFVIAARASKLEGRSLKTLKQSIITAADFQKAAWKHLGM